MQDPYYEKKPDCVDISIAEYQPRKKPSGIYVGYITTDTCIKDTVDKIHLHQSFAK